MSRKHDRCTVCETVFFFDEGTPERCPKCEANDNVIPHLPMPAVKHLVSQIGQVFGQEYGTVRRDGQRSGR